jgi:hypothetical protein
MYHGKTYKTMNDIKNNALSKGIYLSIKLGNPKYECARFGICEMDTEGDFFLPHFETVDNKARAIVALTKKKQVRFLFDRSSLTVKTDKTHFSNGFFTMEVAKELPVAVSDKWGIAPCQIEAGVYAIKAYKQQYKIVMVIAPLTSLDALDCGCSKQATNRRTAVL